MSIRPDTILISLMHVNNETGVIQDIHAIAELTASYGILFHVDAAQSADKCSLNVKKTPVDLISFCAHKIYATSRGCKQYIFDKTPSSCGCPFAWRGPRNGVAFRAHYLRSKSWVWGEAFALAKESMVDEWNRISALRERFVKGLSSIKINGNPTVPHMVNISFSNNIFPNIHKLAVSQGSACLSKRR